MLPVRASPYALVNFVILGHQMCAQINHDHAFLFAKMAYTANINIGSLIIKFGLLLARAESNPISHNHAFLFADRE